MSNKMIIVDEKEHLNANAEIKEKCRKLREEKRKFYKDIVANTGDNAYGDAYSVRDDNMKY